VYKAQATDNDDGIVLDYAVEYGAAPDGPQLASAIKRVTRHAGRVPRAVAADRRYGQAAVERDLHDLGVPVVAIPRQAPVSPVRKTIEHGRGFRRLVRWRTGCEGRISYLKRG
jgi:transposase, IS5 family